MSGLTDPLTEQTELPALRPMTAMHVPTRLRHGFIVLLAALLPAVAPPEALAQPHGAADYPSRPLRFIVPLPPGGGSDFVARLIGQKLGDAFGQQVVIDNRPGASGIIAADIVAKAVPDGYTLLLAIGAHAVNPALTKKLPFDTRKAFAAVSLLARSPIILSAHPSLAANNVRELVALARTRPGQVSVASFGYGAMSHLAAEQLKLYAGIDLLNVPYKGAGEAITHLLGGEVNLMFSSPASVLPQFKSGKLKALALTGKARARVAPDIPTFTEQGLPQVDADNWYGMLVTAGTPHAVVMKLNTELQRILRLPDVIERLALSVDGEPTGSSPAEFRAFFDAEIERWAKLVHDAKLRPQD